MKYRPLYNGQYVRRVYSFRRIPSSIMKGFLFFPDEVTWHDLCLDEKGFIDQMSVLCVPDGRRSCPSASKWRPGWRLYNKWEFSHIKHTAQLFIFCSMGFYWGLGSIYRAASTLGHLYSKDILVVVATQVRWLLFRLDARLGLPFQNYETICL